MNAKLFLALGALALAGCTVVHTTTPAGGCGVGGVPETPDMANDGNCEVRHEGCCYAAQADACAAAGCPEGDCLILDSYPGQVACDTSASTPVEPPVERWTIASERVDCEGEGPMRCMRVREGDGEWTLFYDTVEGLVALEGVEYVVDVRIHEVPNPPEDGSSQRVELVELISETRVGPNPDAATPCQSSDDCAEGQMCAGPEGCEVQWTCQPARPCTRDLRAYCTCDGRTVRGSGSCPPEPFVSRGECSL